MNLLNEVTAVSLSPVANANWRGQALSWLETHLPRPRVAHCIRVETMAVELAQRHGVDPLLAAQAGLMHDLAKYFTPDRLLSVARSAQLALDPMDEVEPHLIHADVSAVVAQRDLRVTQPEVLAAIANHTLGRPGMDALSCIVFLADTLEPGRGRSADLDHLRQLCHQDLAQAVYRTSDYTLAYLIAQGKAIHPRAVLTRNWFLSACRSSPS